MIQIYRALHERRLPNSKRVTSTRTSLSLTLSLPKFFTQREAMGDAGVGMKESMLAPEARDEKRDEGSSTCSNSMTQEVKRVCYIAAPMVIVNLSLYFLQTISLMMVGHIGKLCDIISGVSEISCEANHPIAVAVSYDPSGARESWIPF